MTQIANVRKEVAVGLGETPKNICVIFWTLLNEFRPPIVLECFAIPLL